MNGIERIKERIIDDAKAEAQRIIEEADKKAEEIRAEYEKKAEAARDRIAGEYEAMIAEEKRRAISNARLAMRKKALKVKQEMIDKAFALCLDMAGEMNLEEYKAIMTELLLRSVQTGDEEVILNEADNSRLGMGFIAEINDKLAASGRYGALKASPEAGRFKGGFILRSGGMEINCTFESLLHVVRDEIEPQAAEMLFGHES